MLARMSALSACRLGRGIRPCRINTRSAKPNPNASKTYFRLSHSRLHLDDRRVISGLVHVIRNGLRWRDAPEVYGPHKTPYNRFLRWSRIGVVRQINGF
jgi:transposase